MSIHSTAIVSKRAEIDPSAEIGPGVIIEDDVKIGQRVKIWPYAYICSGTDIGEGTQVHMGTVIGHEPQDHGYKGQKTYTKIGKNNVIREYVTIHRGTAEGSATVIGDNNMLMVQCHLGHNCEIENNVIIANSALLAGHVKVESGSFVSGNVVFHQFCRVGRLAMIGGFTGVNKDVPPYMLVRGPSTVRGVNLVGIRRSGMSRESMREIMEAFKLIYKSDLTLSDAVARIKETLHSDEIGNLVSFIDGSKRGICLYRYSREEYFEG